MSRWLAILCTVACSSSSKTEPTPGSSAPRVPSPADADTTIDEGSLGALMFAVSDGTPAARAHFSRGLLALHSFWYDEATREFEAAIATDPSLRMAYWGAAMSHLPLLWGNDDLTAAKKDVREDAEPRWPVAARTGLGRGQPRADHRHRWARRPRPVREGDGDGQRAVPRRRIGDVPRDRAALGPPRGQCGEAARRRSRDGGMEAQPETSRRRALRDPRARHAGLRESRPAARARVRADRNRLHFHARHMPRAHLQPARHVARSDRELSGRVGRVARGCESTTSCRRITTTFTASTG